MRRMITFYMRLLSILVVGLISLSAWAQVPIEDAQNDQMSVKQQAQSLANQFETKSIQQSKENAQKAESGNGSCGRNPENSKKNKAFLTTKAYDYVYKHVLDYGADEADDIIKPDSSYLQNRINVKKTFFAKPKEDSGLTSAGETVNKYLKIMTNLDMSQKGLKTDDVLDVMDIRREYASIVAAKNLKISLELREEIIDDIKSTQDVETVGCNQMQGILMENRNMAALVKETATDIVVQILMLESLGAKMLLKEEAGLVSLPKKPKESK